MRDLFRNSARIVAAGAFVGLLAGCAHVKQDDFDAEMARIRAEMADGDQNMAQRMDAVEASVAELQDRMDAVETDLQDMAEEYDAAVTRLEASLRFAAPVHFEFDKAEVRSADMEVLMRFASVVREHYPGALVTVEGFTDPSGSAAYNLALGQRRADAVRSVLVDQGRLDSDRVRSVSYGEDTARLVDTSAAGKNNPAAQVNRRVVLVVDHATQATAVVAQQDAGS